MENLFKYFLMSIFLLSSCKQSSDSLNWESLYEQIKKEENTLQARIGVSIFDTRTGQKFHYHSSERFPLNSTHKVLTCSALLSKVEKGQIRLQEKATLYPSDIVAYSPVTEKSLYPKTLTLEELCAAAVSYSDNAADNKIFEVLGGPKAIYEYLQTIGYENVQVTKNEPDMNRAYWGDLDNTVTPDIMVDILKKILLEDGLTKNSQKTLLDWMIHGKVSDQLFRSVLPKNFIIGDKTGLGEESDGSISRGIVAIVWPIKTDKPVIIALYITKTKAKIEAIEGSIREIGKSLFKELIR